jgi:hypothetical protein
LTIVLAVVLAIVATAAATNSESHTIILRTTLSDWHDNGLMVGSGSDGADAVVTRRETGIKRGSKKAVTITSVVDTLEESEGLCVGRIVGVVAHVLDGDVGVADDFTTLKCLWSSIVGVVRVRKRSSLQVVDLHRESKRLAFVLVVVVLGFSEDSRNHLADSWDISHDY